MAILLCGRTYLFGRADGSDIQRRLKDPYIFDFLTLQEAFHERDLETNLLHEVERFLLDSGIVPGDARASSCFGLFWQDRLAH